MIYTVKDSVLICSFKKKRESIQKLAILTFIAKTPSSRIQTTDFCCVRSRYFKQLPRDDATSRFGASFEIELRT